jgi:hypothetical protein
VPIPNAIWRWPLDPFRYPVAGNAVEPQQRVAAKGNAPGRWRANIGAKKPVLDPNRGVAGRGQGEPSKGSPEHRCRRDEPTYEVAARNADGLPNQDGATAGQPSTDKEIQSRAVRRGEASNPLSANVKVRITQLPVEDDPPMTRGQLGRRQSGWRWRTRERP